MPEKDPKLAALRQQGTLNPRPGKVSDPLFVQDSFFDSRDLVQVKYEMLRRVQAENHSVVRTATAFGFSRPSFYQARHTFQQSGLAGLVPHKRGPQQAHKLTKTYALFQRNAGNLGIARALWFSYSDRPPIGPDFWTNHAGLFTVDGKAKLTAPVVGFTRNPNCAAVGSSRTIPPGWFAS